MNVMSLQGLIYLLSADNTEADLLFCEQNKTFTSICFGLHFQIVFANLEIIGLLCRCWSYIVDGDDAV